MSQTKKVICLYGAAGSGKTTTGHGLMYQLKVRGFDCEYNREYIKDWIWEKRNFGEGDQTYFFAKMARKERIYIRNGLDFIITDSPLILTHFYGLKYDWMEQQFNTSEVMLKHHHEYCKKYGYKVEHFFVARGKEYNQAGRNEPLDKAIQFDGEIKELLDKKGIKYKNVPRDNSVEAILGSLLE